jgi:hypothetical protein
LEACRPQPKYVGPEKYLELNEDWKECIPGRQSNSFAFFPVAQFFDHPLSLLQARRLLGRLGGLARQAGWANPSAALATPGCLVQNARLGAESIVTSEANYLRHRIQDFQVFGGSNVSHGFATDRYAVLEGLFSWRDCQRSSSSREASFDLGFAFDCPLVADYFMPHQSSVLQAGFIDDFCHMDLLIHEKASGSFKAQRLGSEMEKALKEK